MKIAIEGPEKILESDIEQIISVQNRKSISLNEIITLILLCPFWQPFYIVLYDIHV